MSTRANIKFINEYEDFIHIDRSHDGYPENVLNDILETINLCKGRWVGSELGQLVSFFLSKNFDENDRIQNYEPCIGYEISGDESYLYYVKWNEKAQKYEFGIDSD